MLNTSSSLLVAILQVQLHPYIIVLVCIGVLQLTIRNVNVYGELTMLHCTADTSHICMWAYIMPRDVCTL